MPKFKPPASEQGMTAYGDGKGNTVAYATRKTLEPTKHYLYMIVDGAWKKVSSSNNPNDFDSIIYPTAES